MFEKGEGSITLSLYNTRIFFAERSFATPGDNAPLKSHRLIKVTMTMPVMGTFLLKFVREVEEIPKIIQSIAVAFGYLPELKGNAY